MVRALLATTAIAALLAGTAIAQDASSTPAMPSSEAPVESSSMMSSEPMDNAMSSQPLDASSSMMSVEAPATTTTVTEPAAPFDIVTGYTQVDTDRLASRIIGQPVYDGTAADANNLGNITDLVLSETGDVQAVVIGVGGFLGLGQKQVAVSFSALEWVVAADNTERFVINATSEQLTNAPDFITTEDSPADGTASSAM